MILLQHNSHSVQSKTYEIIISEYTVISHSLKGIIINTIKIRFSGAVLPIKLKSGSSISEQKIVPTLVYDKMQNDILEKDEAIVILKNKVSKKSKYVCIKNI